MAAFQLLEDEPGHLLVAIRGRLDLEGVHAVENRLSVRISASRKPTILDLSEVPFLASLGMGMIVQLYRALRLHGAGLVLMAPQPLVAEALRNAALDGAIPIVPDRAEALARIGAG